MRLFSGKEVEGKFRGITTLFVAGDVPWDIIESELHSKVNFYAQIYFGADGCSKINWESVRKAINCSSVDIVTAELGTQNYPPIIYLSPKIHWVLQLDELDSKEIQHLIPNLKFRYNIQIKFDTETHSYLAPYTSFVSNAIDDINSDKEIWRSE